MKTVPNEKITDRATEGEAHEKVIHLCPAAKDFMREPIMKHCRFFGIVESLVV